MAALRLAASELHRERRDVRPLPAFAMLDVKRLRATVDAQTPLRRYPRAAAQRQRFGCGLLEVPALAGVGRFVQLVPVAIRALPTVDDQRPVVLGREEKLLDDAETVVGRLTEDRAQTPGLPTIGGEQKERILRQR